MKFSEQNFENMRTIKIWEQYYGSNIVLKGKFYLSFNDLYSLRNSDSRGYRYSWYSYWFLALSSKLLEQFEQFEQFENFENFEHFEHSKHSEHSEHFYQSDQFEQLEKSEQSEHFEL